MDLRHEGPLPVLGLLVEALGELLEVLDPGALPWMAFVVVLLVEAAGVVRAAAVALHVVGVPLGAVGDEVAWIATLKTPRLGAVLLGHPPVIHASDVVVQQAQIFISQSVQLLL